MRFKWLLVQVKPIACLMVACSCYPAQTAPTGSETWLRVELRSQAVVESPSVRLSDIAYLSSTDLELLRHALSIPLGQAPRPGESVALEGEKLGRWIRSRTGLREDQIYWRGSEQTTVSSAVREMPGEEVVAFAQAALSKHIQSIARQKGLEFVRLELEPVSFPGAVQLPVQERRLQVRPWSANAAISSRMMVWVDIFAAERHVRAIPVRFNIAAFAQVPVATRAMPAGVPVSLDTTTMREVDVAAQPGLINQGVWPSKSAQAQTVNASVLRNPTRIGDVISADKVQVKPAVARGEWASLVTRQGPLSLESRVEILQDGQIGQMIRARPANATSVLTARVVGAGQLELQP